MYTYKRVAEHRAVLIDRTEPNFERDLPILHPTSEIKKNDNEIWTK